MCDDLYVWTCSCGAKQAMTKEANAIYRQTHATFYCVHGHLRHYPAGPTEEDKLREQLDAERRKRQSAEQNIAMYADEAREARERAEKERHRANGYKGHATRITKRAKAGVCPCCNRSFENLRRHMATKHPTFTPMELEQTEGATRCSALPACSARPLADASPIRS